MISFCSICFQNSKQKEVFECLQFGRGSEKYSANVRIFCFTVHFYSPKAYEYIRKFFNSILPHIRTIRNWYANIDSSPGFTECSFDSLKQKADEAKSRGEDMNVALIHDDAYVRKLSQWSSSGGKFLGHINAGKPVVHDTFSPLANQVNVLMVSGVGEEFKITIGYFLTQGLCSEERAAILHEAMLKLNNVGVNVCAIVKDGNIVNITTDKILGADYESDKPYFINPFNKNKKVFMILDPPHLLKLARNCLGNKLTIYDTENREIKWSFIENLVTLQMLENINLGNKLTKGHVEYGKNKMNVRMAAETLSSSSAASIEYLDTVEKNDNFRNSEGTVEYIRFCNNTFDVMNTKRKHCNEEYKRPISEKTENEFTTYFEYARKYIKGLQIIEGDKKKPILKSKSFTPYFGFYHNTISFMGIYHDYVKHSAVKEFHTSDVSQDHLESYFGCVRRMGGDVFIQLVFAKNFILYSKLYHSI